MDEQASDDFQDDFSEKNRREREYEQMRMKYQTIGMQESIGDAYEIALQEGFNNASLANDERNKNLFMKEGALLSFSQLMSLTGNSNSNSNNENMERLVKKCLDEGEMMKNHATVLNEDGVDGEFNEMQEEHFKTVNELELECRKEYPLLFARIMKQLGSDA